MKASTHVVIRRDQVTTPIPGVRPWWWVCISDTCPGEEQVGLHHPTQTAALTAALDHCDLYAPENESAATRREPSS